jgi:hypothetical protein
MSNLGRPTENGASAVASIRSRTERPDRRVSINPPCDTV